MFKYEKNYKKYLMKKYYYLCDVNDLISFNLRYFGLKRKYFIKKIIKYFEDIFFFYTVGLFQNNIYVLLKYKYKYLRLNNKLNKSNIIKFIFYFIL